MSNTPNTKEMINDMKLLIGISRDLFSELKETYELEAVSRFYNRCKLVKSAKDVFDVIDNFVELYEGLDNVIVDSDFIEPFICRECVYKFLKMYSDEYENSDEVKSFVYELESNRLLKGASHFVLRRLLELDYIVDDESKRYDFRLESKGETLLLLYSLYFKYNNVYLESFIKPSENGSMCDSNVFK